MSDVKLGTIPTGDSQRDAIHIAVAPVVAGEPLQPAEHVCMVEGAAYPVRRGGVIVGIVDPFRQTRVDQGERFWLCLYQGTVVGMRHHWSHPAFSDLPPNVSRAPASEKWLREFASQHGLDFTWMIDFVKQYGNLCFPNEDYPMDEKDSEVFFAHFNAFTGKNIKGGYFRCAC